MLTPTKSWSIVLVVCLGVVGLLLLRPAPTPPAISAASSLKVLRGVPTPHPTSITMRQFIGVHRLSQVDPRQYNAQTPYRVWWPSACSAAAMTEALNAYGQHYRIADILTVEATFRNPTVITASDGLLSPGGLDRTLRVFGFQAIQLAHPSVAQLEQLARTEPVIVNFPPSTWQGGHFLLVTGGDASHVLLTDSSRLNMRSLSVAVFLSYWRDLAFAVAPRQGGWVA